MSALVDAPMIELLTLTVVLLASGGIGIAVLPWRRHEVDEVSDALATVAALTASAVAHGAAEVGRVALSAADGPARTAPAMGHPAR